MCFSACPALLRPSWLSFPLIIIDYCVIVDIACAHPSWLQCHPSARGILVPPFPPFSATQTPPTSSFSQPAASLLAIHQSDQHLGKPRTTLGILWSLQEEARGRHLPLLSSDCYPRSHPLELGAVFHHHLWLARYQIIIAVRRIHPSTTTSTSTSIRPRTHPNPDPGS